MLGEEIVASWRRNVERANNPVMSSPDGATEVTEKSRASTPQPREPTPSPAEPILNGNPKSPEDNNNQHLSNNNVPLVATMCAVNNFLRNEESMKSPFSRVG